MHRISFWVDFISTRSKYDLGHKMINAGQMTRDEALKQEEQRIATIEPNLANFLESVGLSKEEIDTVFSFQRALYDHRPLQ